MFILSLTLMWMTSSSYYNTFVDWMSGASRHQLARTESEIYYNSRKDMLKELLLVVDKLE